MPDTPKKTWIDADIFNAQWYTDEQGRQRPKPSADLLPIARAATGGRVLLGMSGKDSLAMWLYLREQDFEIIPYQFYTVPGGLSFENIAHEYYQDFFKQKIAYLPHPNFIKFWNAGQYQSPVTAQVNRNCRIPPLDYYQVEERLAQEHGLGSNYLAAIGYRASDNPGRRRLINNMGAIGGHARHYFYAIWDWLTGQVMDKIHQYGAKLSPQYAIFGSTFDEYDWYQLKVLYREAPQDLQALLTYFPLLLAKVVRFKHVA